ncbi:MAG TPA: branched-chain amino acid ABC transporter permease [Bellilinea sp.]|jgi:branched-chain amino acid transport system permease protein|nr:branched-chain amino acid ABC transporter permease [Bellilinea sp.]
MRPEIFFQTLVNGLFIGGIYSLVAIGLTMIYGVMLIMNFAHGEFLMLGMYIAYGLFTMFGIDPYLAAPIAAILVFLLGAAIQGGLIQRVLNAHPLNQIILLLGVSTLMVGLVQFFLTAEPRNIHVAYETEVLTFLGLRLSIPRLIAFLASLVIASLLYMFLQHTRTGKAIRAVSQNRSAALLMGVNTKFIYMLTFGIGAAVTAVAGVLLTPNYKMIPTIGSSFSVIAFVVVVLGTMGNFIGAFLGGLIIGIVEVFAGYFLGGDVKMIASMLVFILVLLFKPAGLFGRKNA